MIDEVREPGKVLEASQPYSWHAHRVTANFHRTHNPSRHQIQQKRHRMAPPLGYISGIEMAGTDDGQEEMYA